MRSALTFLEWLTLYSPPLLRYGRIVNLSSTSYVESLTYLWSFNSISWKLCECTSNLRFWVINPLFPDPIRGTVESSTSPSTCVPGVIDVPVKFQLSILKTVRMHVEFTFFWVINPLFLSPTGSGIVEASDLLRDLSRRVVDVPVKFQLCDFKTVRMHAEITLF